MKAETLTQPQCVGGERVAAQAGGDSTNPSDASDIVARAPVEFHTQTITACSWA